MKMYVLATRDIVANVWSQPMFFPHIGIAIRGFGDQCRDKTTELGKHPEDYELWMIGEYDDVTGQMEPGIQPDSRKQLAVGANYRE